jgi:hypothetical protein
LDCLFPLADDKRRRVKLRAVSSASQALSLLYF